MKAEHQGASLLGHLVSVDCHLTVLAVDGRYAPSWDAVVRDFDKTQAMVGSPAFKRSRAFAVQVGAGQGCLFSVGVPATGSCAVYRVGDRVVLVEPDAEYFEDRREDSDSWEVEPFLRRLAEKPPLPKAKPPGRLELPSGILLVGDMWSDYTKSATKLKRLAARRSGVGSVAIGDEDNGIALIVHPGRYALYPQVYAPPWRRGRPTEDRIGVVQIVLEPAR